MQDETAKSTNSLSTGQASMRNAQMVKLAGAHLISKAIYVFAQLGIAEYLNAKPLNADELASATSTHGPTLYRMLRTLAGYGLVAEDAEQRFSLSPLGATLVSDAPGEIRSLVSYLAGPIVWASVGALMHSVRTGEEATKKVFGRSFFEFAPEMPEDAQIYNEAISAMHGMEPQAVAAAYDFSDIRTLVDVGGGTGNLLTKLLLTTPHLSGVLYERPDVAAEARRHVAALDLTSRCEVIDGSFFDTVPVGGDAYMLSHIVHNWDDASCLQILGRCHAAMHGTGRLLLLEQVVSPGNNREPAKFNDLVMLAMWGGKERTEREFADLLAQSGFKMTRIVPTESPSSIVEAVTA